jgi:phosphate transport system substrate-binding protein
MKKARFVKAAVAVISLSFVLAAPAQAVDLAGSGASFPDNLLQNCKAPFAAAGSNTYQYAVSDSAGGQTDAKNGKGDFWFSDSIWTAKLDTIQHVPVVAGPVAIAYNLNGNAGKTLALSADTIAGIFGGKITKWNDPAIVKDANRTVTTTTYVTKNGVIVKNADGTNKVLATRTTKLSFTLPNRPIKVVYRADGSGTTKNFINYLKGAVTTDLGWLADNSFETGFKATGASLSDAANLGRFIGRTGSSGVANEVAKTVDSITYVAPSAINGAGRAANVYNAAGKLVDPVAPGAVASFLASAKAGAVAGTYVFDFKTTEAGAYPISIVSYMLVSTAYASASQAAAVKALATFILSPACADTVGSKYGFAVITGSAKANAEKQIALIAAK